MQTWIRREAPTPTAPGTLMGEAWFTNNTCDWRPVEYVWSSGDTTRITVYLEDVEGEENGNDFGIDDLEFYECGPHSTSPVNVQVGPGGVATFSVSAWAHDPLSYRWQRENPPGNWVDLSNGPTGTGSSILGATTANLVLFDVSRQDAGRYRAMVTSCSSIATSAARLRVSRWFQPTLHGIPVRPGF
jgi:hypothetical protein